MHKTIEIPIDLYQRLGFHVEGFESPADVIERILNFYEEQTGAATTKTKAITPVVSQPVSLEIIYYPDNDERKFKENLLREKVAYLLLHKIDGSKEIKRWNALNFKPNSSVNGNLRSGYLRGWKKKGIVKAEISTNKNDLIS